MDPQRLGEVVAAAKAGDSRAYRELLDVYGRRLYGYFLRATGRHHDAEDLLGELMLRLVAKLGNYDDRGRFEPWLFRIAANMVRDRIRRMRSSPPPTSLSAEGEPGAVRGDQLLAQTDDVETGLVAEEASADLAEALARVHRGLRALRRLMGSRHDDER